MPILLILFSVTAMFSQETASTQMTPSAPGFPKTAVVRTGESGTDCETQLAVANQRLQKALDAYDKAVALAIAKDDVIAAKDALIGLIKEGSAIKDQFIADLQADNAFLRKANQPTVKSKVRKFFETVEKVLLVAGGIYLGSKL